MKKAISSTLIIATYNWPAALDLCLKSVMRQVVMPDEIIIADDGSGAETKEVIEKHQQKCGVRIKHIWHQDEGFRKSIILNKAVKECSSDYIIQVDGDVILDKNFVSDHLNSAEKNTFLRGTRAMLDQEKTEKVLQEGIIRFSPFESGLRNWYNAIRLPLLYTIGSRKEMSSKRVRGSNLSFWKSDFIRVNGYNNDLTGWGHEDEELAARFINNGIIKKIIKLCAVQYHLHHTVHSKSNEPEHATEVDKVVAERLKTCSNGYRETI